MRGTSAWKSYLPRSRRQWFLIALLGTLTTVVITLLLPLGANTSQRATDVPTSPPPASQTAAGPGPAAGVNPAPADVAVSPGEPQTLDFKAYAEDTARALYTWDTRTSSYTQVYSHVRSWWIVLPDGSNPLTVYTQEFEGTGINSAAFAQLSAYGAHRTATIVQASCDKALVQFRDHPAPWVGLHVCTMTVSVTDRSTADPHKTAYHIPVSVMVNCPPAATAPAHRCALAGFYTSASRIVY
ncbi:hypothetical protein [Arthrobacter glacialis]|uniref:hypothetical protein n=1 Tax=Arthrobacter glacialis TaxID=1664 RepID=UPI000CD3AC5F|nr:hypothetical protein [Arthrobacter glacialis]POH60334.1 hypothetical protein CVS28_05255 [Arthrobacter glacialis]